MMISTNENIVKTLTDLDGLKMSEVVGNFTGQKVGATYFHKGKTLDDIWATTDIEVVGSCVMPVEYMVGDHQHVW